MKNDSFRGHAPAFEQWQLAQLDPPKPMIAKGAQERILFKTSPKWLSIESANAPSQTRVPSTSSAAAVAARTSVPRDKQWTNPIVPIHPKRSDRQKSQAKKTGDEKKDEQRGGVETTTHYLSSPKSGSMGLACGVSAQYSVSKA
jgi:hypothetical protein